MPYIFEAAMLCDTDGQRAQARIQEVLAMEHGQGTAAYLTAFTALVHRGTDSFPAYVSDDELQIDCADSPNHCDRQEWCAEALVWGGRDSGLVGGQPPSKRAFGRRGKLLPAIKIPALITQCLTRDGYDYLNEAVVEWGRGERPEARSALLMASWVARFWDSDLAFDLQWAVEQLEESDRIPATLRELTGCAAFLVADFDSPESAVGESGDALVAQMARALRNPDFQPWASLDAARPYLL